MAERFGNMPFHNISHDNNMAVVRYYLSFCVLIAHTATLAGISLPWSRYSFVAVGGFFSLSGFLLFSSFQKSATCKQYLSRRARRILPPYFLIVLLCAISFVFVSTLSWQEYYSDMGFWKYLAANLSFLNFLHPDLPGVFTGDAFKIAAVNGSLWTMKGEWVCYLSVPVIFLLIKKCPKYSRLYIISLIILSYLCQYAMLYIEGITGKSIYGILANQFGSILVFFYSGALINLLYPQFLKYKWYIMPVCVIIIAFSGFYEYVYYLFLRPIVVSSLVIWVSQVGKWGYFLRNHDDLSYDIYLFHFPIIQLVILWGLPKECSPLVVLLTVVALTAAMAFLSWNLVGKRFLKMKRT